MKNKRILILTDKINYNDGVTTYLHNFLSAANNKKIDFYLCSPGGDRIKDFKPLVSELFISKRFEYDQRNYINSLFYIVFVLIISNLYG